MKNQIKDDIDPMAEEMRLLKQETRR